MLPMCNLLKNLSSHKLSIPVELIGRGSDQQVSRVGVIGQVSSILGNSCLVMSSILGMESQRSVGTQECNFRVVFCKNL